MGWGGVQDWRLWQTVGPRLQATDEFAKCTAPNFSYCGTRHFGTSAVSIRIGWESPHEGQVRLLLALVSPARRQIRRIKSIIRKYTSAILVSQPPTV